MNSRNSFFVNPIALLAIGIFVTEGRAPQKLISGTDAIPGELKYQAAVCHSRFCKGGGALISEKHVLTVAHVFVGYVDPPYIRNVHIITGMTRRSKLGEKHKPKYVTIHPRYVKGNKTTLWRNDIAVVTLLTPAKTNVFQAPIALPLGVIGFDESVTAIVSGWGYVKNQTRPDVLQKSYVTIIPQAVCKSYRKVLPTYICGLDGVNTGTCRGDSGGALVYKNEVVGLVSIGPYNGSRNFPDVYTRVSSFVNFINKTMERYN